MSNSVKYLDRAENCAQLADETASTPAKNRYKRMEAGWRALAAEQQWLDGEPRSERDCSIAK
jgi:hypothetical protein